MNARGIDRVLVTGGAGFIGSHTVDLLLERDYEVIILDSLVEQVHHGKFPDYLPDGIRFVRGDIRDRELLIKLLRECQAVIHLAAAVGVGQSMYEVENYVDANTRGTSLLLDVLVNEEHDVKKVVVASSMSIYGEGKYFCEECGEPRFPGLRLEEQLAAGVWEHRCHVCGNFLKHLPTDEEKPLMPTSIYAMSKRHQEEMVLLIGRTYGIPSVALRYFNVYGPRQSLSNPYTGACAIFVSRILNGKPPFIFEDGRQLRDFIHVKDVAKANLLALENSSADYMAVNVGTGKPKSILSVANLLTELIGGKVQPYVSGKFRKGDVRHCYADTSNAERLLGFKAEHDLYDGLKELAEWGKLHGWSAMDLFEKSLEELRTRGLTSA
ncbi:MAG: NAD-dependent epimerase/dehydratase family protein [Nitrososphaerota archaeon]